MRDNLLERIAPRLKDLSGGGYARAYRKGRRLYPSDLHLFVREILDAAGAEFKEDQPILGGSALRADFLLGETAILIGRSPGPRERKALERTGRRCVLVTTSAGRSDELDSGFRVLRLGSGDGTDLQTIFLDDPSFNFDYAHILPQTEKCSVMHGHTSSALVEIIGAPRNGMVVDFNDAKPVIREAIGEMDHKLFIDRKYVTGETRTHVDLTFTTVHGDFALKVPRKTTVILRGEATVENLARELLDRIAPRMPANVTAVGVYVYEGLNKGTHLLAEVHRREAEKRRSAR